MIYVGCWRGWRRWSFLSSEKTEPYYEGVLVADICTAMCHTPTRIEAIGVPHKVLSRYGEPEQHDEEIGLTPKGIRRRIERFLSE